MGKKYIRDLGSVNPVCSMVVELSQTDGDGVMAAAGAASSGDCKVLTGHSNMFKQLGSLGHIWSLFFRSHAVDRPVEGFLDKIWLVKCLCLEFCV